MTEKEEETMEETKIELPEEVEELLNTLICNIVEDFLKVKKWQELSEGTNN